MLQGVNNFKGTSEFGTVQGEKDLSVKGKILNIVIVEDEKPAYERLSKMLIRILYQKAVIHDQLDSIASAKRWFAAHQEADIVFMDVHLADGSAFDLLKQIRIGAPIIFVTAFDQYTLDAFKTDSIDYLMKPVKKEDLQNALLKLNRFSRMFSSAPDPGSPDMVAPMYKKRFIVRYGEHIRTLDVKDIAYCFSTNKSICARTFSGNTFPIDYNLDVLEQALDPVDFFRLNRKYLAHINAIDDMRTYSKGRVFVSLNPAVEEDLIVSSEKSPRFKRWLGGEL